MPAGSTDAKFLLRSSRAKPRDDAGFRCALGGWFRKNGRDLPWRRTRDPYAVLVSEIMLQQTQVGAVISYYNEWLRRFPTVGALARASEGQVLRAWQGLGYYSRARNLHRCAKIALRRFSGKLPRDPTQLRLLPGIGHYTANAIAVFAFDRSLPLVEANTARVLARLFNIRERIDSNAGRRRLWEASGQLVPKSRPREFHSALMDLGAVVCRARNPRCDICPVKQFCAAPDPCALPVKRRRPPAVALEESHALITRASTVLLAQCRTRWRGMWTLPSIVPTKNKPIYVSSFRFTHHQVTLQVFRGRLRRLNPGERWFSHTQLRMIPMPSPHRRALESLLAQS